MRRLLAAWLLLLGSAQVRGAPSSPLPHPGFEVLASASHYWPLENVDGIHELQDTTGDIVEGKVNKGIYLKEEKRVTLLYYGHYKTSCISNPARCGPQGVTFSFFWKTQGGQSRPALSAYGGQVISDGFKVCSSGGQGSVQVHTRENSRTWGATFSPPGPYWTHVLFTWKPKEGLKVYVNGTLSTSDPSGSVSHAYGEPNVSLVLGSAQDPAKHYENGAFDEFIIWERALTPDEVAMYFTAAIDPYTSRSAALAVPMRLRLACAGRCRPPPRACERVWPVGVPLLDTRALGEAHGHDFCVPERPSEQDVDRAGGGAEPRPAQPSPAHSEEALKDRARPQRALCSPRPEAHSTARRIRRPEQSARTAVSVAISRGCAGKHVLQSSTPAGFLLTPTADTPTPTDAYRPIITNLTEERRHFQSPGVVLSYLQNVSLNLPNKSLSEETAANLTETFLRTVGEVLLLPSWTDVSEDSSVVLGLINTVDTVMGHISSNLRPSEVPVTIAGPSSMADFSVAQLQPRTSNSSHYRFPARGQSYIEIPCQAFRLSQAWTTIVGLLYHTLHRHLSDIQPASTNPLISLEVSPPPVLSQNLSGSPLITVHLRHSLVRVRTCVLGFSCVQASSEWRRRCRTLGRPDSAARRRWPEAPGNPPRGRARQAWGSTRDPCVELGWSGDPWAPGVGCRLDREEGSRRGSSLASCGLVLLAGGAEPSRVRGSAPKPTPAGRLASSIRVPSKRKRESARLSLPQSSLVWPRDASSVHPRRREGACCQRGATRPLGAAPARGLRALTGSTASAFRLQPQPQQPSPEPRSAWGGAGALQPEEVLLPTKRGRGRRLRPWVLHHRHPDAWAPAVLGPSRPHSCQSPGSRARCLHLCLPRNPRFRVQLLLQGRRPTGLGWGACPGGRTQQVQSLGGPSLAWRGGGCGWRVIASPVHGRTRRQQSEASEQGHRVFLYCAFLDLRVKTEMPPAPNSFVGRWPDGAGRACRQPWGRHLPAAFKAAVRAQTGLDLLPFARASPGACTLLRRDLLLLKTQSCCFWKELFSHLFGTGKCRKSPKCTVASPSLCLTPLLQGTLSGSSCSSSAPLGGRPPQGAPAAPLCPPITATSAVVGLAHARDTSSAPTLAAAGLAPSVPSPHRWRFTARVSHAARRPPRPVARCSLRQAHASPAHTPPGQPQGVVLPVPCGPPGGGCALAAWPPRPADCVCALSSSDGVWSDEGCVLTEGNLSYSTCRCTHLTNFAILMQVVPLQVRLGPSQLVWPRRQPCGADLLPPVTQACVQRKLWPGAAGGARAALVHGHQVALSSISYVGCSLSVVCLAATLTTFAMLSSVSTIRNQRYHIHANLSLAVLVAQVLLLVSFSFDTGTDASVCQVPCRVLAVLLHYFFLSAFAWMLAEGLHLYSMVVKVFGSEDSKHLCYYGIGAPAVAGGRCPRYAVPPPMAWGAVGGAGTSLSETPGWADCSGMPARVGRPAVTCASPSPRGDGGCPLVICAISVATAMDSYGTSNNCWLSLGSGAIWAFVGPALLVVVANAGILVAVTRAIAQVSTGNYKIHGDPSVFKLTAKAVAVLLPILGTSWVFGVLAISSQAVVFQYLFAVLNSLQGLFIFLFHCLLNSEVRLPASGCCPIPPLPSPCCPTRQHRLLRHRGGGPSHPAPSCGRCPIRCPIRCPRSRLHAEPPHPQVRAAFKHKTKVWSLTSSSARRGPAKPFSSDTVNGTRPGTASSKLSPWDRSSHSGPRVDLSAVALRLPAAATPRHGGATVPSGPPGGVLAAPPSQHSVRSCPAAAVAHAEAGRSSSPALRGEAPAAAGQALATGLSPVKTLAQDTQQQVQSGRGVNEPVNESLSWQENKNANGATLEKTLHLDPWAGPPLDGSQAQAWPCALSGAGSPRSPPPRARAGSGQRSPWTWHYRDSGRVSVPPARGARCRSPWLSARNTCVRLSLPLGLAEPVPPRRGSGALLCARLTAGAGHRAGPGPRWWRAQETAGAAVGSRAGRDPLDHWSIRCPSPGPPGEEPEAQLLQPRLPGGVVQAGRASWCPRPVRSGQVYPAVFLCSVTTSGEPRGRRCSKETRAKELTDLGTEAELPAQHPSLAHGTHAAVGSSPSALVTELPAVFRKAAFWCEALLPAAFWCAHLRMPNPTGGAAISTRAGPRVSTSDTDGGRAERPDNFLCSYSA
ncbi:Adhesion G-protein coupled receptor D1 [Galemys pyrenaicus]|uniref:Adhesion G-protein coupled receptor D1 n=1 Tax=Galemys pyrenaicus TaxID=202257 RepID=A0A8J6DPB3_GALPY|nr:Adhesion G-protein coupled receptor D1 [Galemys pyrenaicus]